MRSKIAAARTLVTRGSMLAAIFALGACQHDNPRGYPYMGGPDNFGEANRVTMATQVIDPDPVYDTAVPETYGEHAAQAIERYRTDKVKKPDKIRTSSTDSSGGSGGGGN